MIEYPKNNLWTMCMVTGESVDTKGTKYYHIFVPTTPNPTSGYMIFSPIENVIETDISVEEGMRIIISGGMLAPTENSIANDK